MRRFMIFAIPILWTAGNAHGVSLRTIRQLNALYSSATAISASNYNIQLINREVNAALPTKPDVAGYKGSVVKAASKLAAAYCIEFIYRERAKPAAERRAHAAIDFALTPDELTSEALASTMAMYAELFWGRSATTPESALFLQAALAARDAAPKNQMGTRHVLVATCALVGASLESLIIQD